MDITIDFETRSELDLGEVGLYRYAEHPSTDVLCAAWMIDEGPTVEEWDMFEVPIRIVHACASPYTLFHAFNAQFEIEIWKKVLTPRYGWPECPPLHRWRDTMAMAAVAGLPQTLDGSSMVAGIEKKGAEGKALIKFFSCPNKQGRFVSIADNEERFNAFRRYNIQDVRAERSVHHYVNGFMTDREQKVWEHVCLMNQRGLPIDIPLLDRMNDVLDLEVRKATEEITNLTSGLITKPTQVQRMVKLLKDEGVDTDSVAEDVVKALLDGFEEGDIALTDLAHKVLQFRFISSSSSVAKFRRIREMLCDDGTVKGNLRYYGAGPGRHSGMGFQPQNLPRYGHGDDVDRIIEMFMTVEYELLSLMFPILKYSKGLIRPIIKAPEGTSLLVDDFSGVETVAVAWLCKEDELLRDIKAGLRLYILQAAPMFGKRYEDIPKGSLEDQVGKICVLSCGYAGGYRVFLKEAKKNKKMHVTEADAKRYVSDFRRSRPKVTQAWRDFEDAALQAMSRQGDIVEVPGMRVTFQKYREWLRMMLPSGRYIYYPKAELHEMAMKRTGRMGAVITSYWIDSTTKQWCKREMSGPLFFQNCIQGLCRDLLVEAQLRLEDRGYQQIGSVHDEAVGLSPDYMGHTLKGMTEIMTELPEWAAGFPLKASGFQGPRYKKD